MIRRAPALCTALAAWSLSASALAQGAWENPARSGSVRPMPSGYVIGVQDCPTEQWRFRVALSEVPEGDLAVYVRAATDATATLTCAAGERGMSCHRLLGSAVRRDGMSLEFTVAASMLATPPSGGCVSGIEGRARVFVVANPDASGAVVASSPYVRFDLSAPEAPRNVRATSAGEGRVSIAWEREVTTLDGGTSIVDSGASVMDAGEATDATVNDVGVTDTGSASSQDAGVVPTAARYFVLCEQEMSATCSDASTGALGAIDPYDQTMINRFLCNGDASVLTGNSAGAVVPGLRTGVSWRFGVIAEDFGGNRSPVGVSPCMTVQEFNDFWESYRGAGGGGQPGVCSARPWSSSATSGWWALGFALVWGGRRRYRARFRGFFG